ncbi:uncharacterized protein LOC134463312 isoform X2 [Engraulis encrasicolus]|uniref:uncharacterized protein LOC134437185 isoform X2 n=1 Tax=Engraulis encrasicolus TaxID=184585 RepID=UPI002FD28449
MERQTWTRRETLSLIAVLADLDALSALDGKRQRNATIFQGVAKELERRGVVKPWQAFRTKYKALKARYLVEKRQASRSGAGGRRRFEFFDEMDQLLGARPIVVARTSAVDSTVPLDDQSRVEEEEEDDDEEMDEEEEGADLGGQVTMEDSEPPAPTPAAAGGSRLFRRPLKKKTGLAAVSQQLSDLLKRQERQEEADREMLTSLTTSVKRLVDCLERQNNPLPTASSSSQVASPSFPTYPHPSPSPFLQNQNFMYMQQQSYSSTTHSPDFPTYTEM